MDNLTCSKEQLKELLWLSPGEIDEDSGFKLVAKERIGESRWSSQHMVVFEFADQLWGSYYSQGLSETQDQSPYEYDDPIVFPVEAKEVTKIAYFPKKGE